MTAQTRDSYPLGRSQAETERLMWSARQMQVSIRSFLEEAGVEPGMKVLDVGSGAGDIAFLAAEVVGPAGSVTGIDLNDTILDTARKRASESGAGNVRFVTARIPDDLRSLDNDYDAIIGRRVLCYIPEPAKALEALLMHARSGAIVAFQEIDWTIWAQHSFPLAPYYEQVWGLIYRAFLAGGTDMSMGTGLYAIFLDAGLPEPLMKAEAGVGSPMAGLPFTMNLLRSTRETIIREGIAPAEDVDPDVVEQRLRAEYAELRTVVTGGFEVRAWARKP